MNDLSVENGSHTLKLWIMMFLQFFIYGAWLPLANGYLGENGAGFSWVEQTAIMSAFPVAAFVSMFFSNQFADRNFSAEKFLAFSHLLSGGFLLGMYGSVNFWGLLICMWGHCLLYVPTISITNSIAFAALKDAKREFGIVRMGGTIGWIVVSWPLFFLLEDTLSARIAFLIAGIASICLAGFSLLLPHTPANKKGESLAWLQALKMLSKPFVLVLWLVALFDAAIHDIYFLWTWDFLVSIDIETKWIMPIMSIGQAAEIVTMAMLGFFLKHLGWKTTLIIGILGHAARFAIFSFAPQPMLIMAGIFLHGICYAFFFATIYIFVDEFFPADMRSSAQGLFNVMILGAGPLMARMLGPMLKQANTYTIDGLPVVDYRRLFQIPLCVALVAAAVLLIGFWPPKNKNQNQESE